MFLKLPRVWRYFFTYIGKGILFLITILVSMLLLDTVLSYLNVDKELRTPIWFAVYFGSLAIWFMWDEAKRKVELDNIKLLKSIKESENV